MVQAIPGLAVYVGSVVEQGYAELVDLSEADDADLEQIVLAAKMKRPHAKRFTKACKALQTSARAEHQHENTIKGDVRRVGHLSFNERTDVLGNGRFGEVFRCEFDGEAEAFAVKQIPKLRFEREGGKKEIEVLLHAQASDDGGHRNVVRYKAQRADERLTW